MPIIQGGKVVVTGGAGFIGSHLAEELAKGNEVIIIDDLSTGSEANITPLLIHANIRYVRGSIADLDLLQETLKDTDFVFHQAAISSVPKSIEDPLASNQANITGTLNVLVAARDNRIRKVVFASSSSVYGDTPILPKKEDMHPNPMSPYALTKLTGEYYCKIFQQIYGLPTICLRYFNVYGPKQNPDSQYAAVIPKFIKRLSQNKSPIIFGDGNQTRDFIFIKDVVEANILAALSESTGIFNIGSGKNISLNELAQIIMNIMGVRLEPIHQDQIPGDVKHSLADIAKAKTFGYNPNYSLEEGIKNIIKH